MIPWVSMWIFYLQTHLQEKLKGVLSLPELIEIPVKK